MGKHFQEPENFSALGNFLNLKVFFVGGGRIKNEFTIILFELIDNAWFGQFMAETAEVSLGEKGLKKVQLWRFKMNKQSSL